MTNLVVGEQVGSRDIPEERVPALENDPAVARVKENQWFEKIQ